MPIKKKKNKYPQTVLAEIDLHGMLCDEALHEVREVLGEYKDKNITGKIRIITGKGVNSPDGKAVLRPAVASLLDDMHVRYTVAPIDQGGDGAFMVDV